MALLAELVLEAAQAVAAPGRGQHTRAFAGEYNRGFTTDTAGCSENQNHLIFERNGHVELNLLSTTLSYTTAETCKPRKRDESRVLRAKSYAISTAASCST